MGRLGVFALVASLVIAGPAGMAVNAAQADDATALSANEAHMLARGQTVIRKQVLERGEQRFVGGVAYTIVDAPADDVPALFANAEALRRILPRTRAANEVGSADGDALIRLTQGTALIQASYTMRIHRSGREVRFWMDPHARHDISDAWGFLRAAPLGDGRALVTYGVLVDMGPGLLRELFEERVRDVALSVADRMRGFVLQRNAAGARAAR